MPISIAAINDALAITHPVQKRTGRAHPEGRLDIPFIVFNSASSRRTPWDSAYQKGSLDGDKEEHNTPAWFVYGILALKYDIVGQYVMCLADWGAKYDYYRYQWIPFAEITDSDVRACVLDNIVSERILRVRRGQEFWVSRRGETAIRKSLEEIEEDASEEDEEDASEEDEEDASEGDEEDELEDGDVALETAEDD